MTDKLRAFLAILIAMNFMAISPSFAAEDTSSKVTCVQTTDSLTDEEYEEEFGGD